MQDKTSETVSERLEQLISFADEILDRGRDIYSGQNTPLFVDGLDLDASTPITGSDNEGQWVACNMAGQQNFFRFLNGLTGMTGMDRFKKAACAALEYHFDYLQSPCGLMQWGSSRHIDLKTMEVVACSWKSGEHVLKFHLPYYELMWEVDPSSTGQQIRAFWNAHIFDWNRLDMNRIGRYGLEMGKLWNHDFTPPEPFFEGDGLSFINCGTDLIYAGTQLYNLDGDCGALKWARRLAHQYVRARHAETGLGVYQYSQARRRKEPPTDTGAPDYTYSTYGDRVKRQFGPEFGEVALEGNFLPPSTGHSIYGNNALIQLQIAEMLGEEGVDFLEWTVEGLKSYIQHAYLPEVNILKPLWADGTDLSFYTIKRYGYKGEAGDVITPAHAGGILFLSAALGYRLTEDESLWVMVRNIARGMGLGDIGTVSGKGRDPNLKTANSDPVALFGLLELYRSSRDEMYLRLADTIGGNIYTGCIDPKNRNNRMLLSQPHFLALLHLEEIRSGSDTSIPSYRGGR